MELCVKELYLLVGKLQLKCGDDKTSSSTKAEEVSNVMHEQQPHQQKNNQSSNENRVLRFRALSNVVTFTSTGKSPDDER